MFHMFRTGKILPFFLFRSHAQRMFIVQHLPPQRPIRCPYYPDCRLIMLVSTAADWHLCLAVAAGVDHVTAPRMRTGPDWRTAVFERAPLRETHRTEPGTRFSPDFHRRPTVVAEGDDLTIKGAFFWQFHTITVMELLSSLDRCAATCSQKVSLFRTASRVRMNFRPHQVSSRIHSLFYRANVILWDDFLYHISAGRLHKIHNSFIYFKFRPEEFIILSTWNSFVIRYREWHFLPRHDVIHQR